MGIPFPEEYGGAGRRLAGAMRWRSRSWTRVDSSGRDHDVRPHLAAGPSRSTCSAPRNRSSEWAGPRLCSGRDPRRRVRPDRAPRRARTPGNVRTRGRRSTDGEWVINGAKQFITNAGTEISGVVSASPQDGPGETRDLQPDRRANGTPGYDARSALPEDGLERLGHATAQLRRLSRAARGTCWARAAAASSQFLHVLDIGRIGVAAMGSRTRPRAPWMRRWPTPRSAGAFGQPISELPIDPGQAGQHVDGDRCGPAARIQGGLAQGPQTELLADCRPGQAEERHGCAVRRRPTRRSRSTAAYGPHARSTRSAGSTADAKVLTIGEGKDEVQEMVIARALGA